MTSKSMSKPRPKPSEKRPPVSRCIVVPNVAVTSRWRVLWFVAAVAIAELGAHRAGRAAQRARVLGVEPLGDEDRPEAELLGPLTSVTRSRGVAECPANP